MLRMVLDTNVLVSSIILLGKPRELLGMIAEREATLVLSKEIMNEFMKVMKRKKFTELVTEEHVERFVENMERIAEFVEPESDLEVVEDLKDDIIINTAIDGRADLIVSGDHHLLSLKEFRGIKIVSVDGAVRTIKKRR